MKHVVVAGAGPIGLYTAIRLKQMGVKEVTVVDPRAGAYTRDGILDISVFKNLEAQLQLPIPYSSSHHIKDVERALYDHAIRCGVTIKKSEFVTFSRNQMQVKDPKTGAEELIACDLALDSTGPKRALLNEVNRLAEKPIYQITAAAENPLKNHFIAYVKMAKEDAALLASPLDEASTQPLKHALAFERLRSEFGWPEFAKPSFNYQILDKNKVCLYFETPPNLPHNQQEAWLKALLEARTGKKDFNFERLTPISRKTGLKKPRFIPFTVDPQKATSKEYRLNSQAPFVIPIGDAQIEPDYRLGLGITSGINRVNALLESIQVKHDDTLDFRLEKYEALVSGPLSKHEAELKSIYESRSATLKQALKEKLSLYQTALSKTNDEQRPLLMQALEELHHRIALEHFKEAKEFNKRTRNAQGGIELDRYGNITGELALLRENKALEDAYKALPHSNHSFKLQIEKYFLQLAKDYKEVAKKLFTLKKQPETEKYYQLALECYNRYFPGEYQDETLKLKSNLILLAYQMKAYDKAISMATQALKILPTIQMDEKERFQGKITYHLASALIDKWTQDFSTPKNQASLPPRSELDKLYSLVESLKSNPTIAAADVLKLQDKIKAHELQVAAVIEKEKKTVYQDADNDKNIFLSPFKTKVQANPVLSLSEREEKDSNKTAANDKIFPTTDNDQITKRNHLSRKG